MFCTNQKIPAYASLVMIPAGAFTPKILWDNNNLGYVYTKISQFLFQVFFHGCRE